MIKHINNYYVDEGYLIVNIEDNTYQVNLQDAFGVFGNHVGINNV